MVLAEQGRLDLSGLRPTVYRWIEGWTILPILRPFKIPWAEIEKFLSDGDCEEGTDILSSLLALDSRLCLWGTGEYTTNSSSDNPLISTHSSNVVLHLEPLDAKAH